MIVAGYRYIAVYRPREESQEVVLLKLFYELADWRRAVLPRP